MLFNCAIREICVPTDPFRPQIVFYNFHRYAVFLCLRFGSVHRLRIKCRGCPATTIRKVDFIKNVHAHISIRFLHLSGDHRKKLLLGQNGDTQFPGLGELAPGLLPANEVAGLASHGATSGGTEADDLAVDAVTGERQA